VIAILGAMSLTAGIKQLVLMKAQHTFYWQEITLACGCFAMSAYAYYVLISQAIVWHDHFDQWWIDMDVGE